MAGLKICIGACAILFIILTFMTGYYGVKGQITDSKICCAGATLAAFFLAAFLIISKQLHNV